MLNLGDSACMSKPRTRLPISISSRPFTVSEAQKSGVSPKVLAHSRFSRPFRNVRVPEELRETVSPEECFAYVLREGEAFSHTTALRLLGCPIRCGTETHVTVPAHGRARRASGVIGHSTRREFEVATTRSGLCVVPPELALIQSAGMLPLREMVVAIDHLIKRVTENPNAGERLELDPLRKVVHRSTARGGRNLGKALKYVRVGAESRMETLLWLLLEAFGLAGYFEAQVEIFDVDGWIGRFDLVCERFKLIVEYDGEQHRKDRNQYLKDERRLDRVRAVGYLVIRLRAVDVIGNGRRAAVRRIADALEWTGPLAILDPELV